MTLPILAGNTTFSKDEVAYQTSWAAAYVRISLSGVITDFRLAPTNVHALGVAAGLLQAYTARFWDVREPAWELERAGYWKPVCGMECVRVRL